MDSIELREAAELAGLRITEQPKNTWHALSPFREGAVGKDIFVYKQDDPALPACIASLLVARAQRDGIVQTAIGLPTVNETSVTVGTDPAAPGGMVVRSRVTHADMNTAIIRAAVAALKESGE